MKRLFAIFLSICLLATLFAGCSQSPETDGGPVTITIWHDKEDEVAAALQAELDKLAPDIAGAERWLDRSLENGRKRSQGCPGYVFLCA